MRISKLARTYNLSMPELTAYLEEKNLSHSLHPNAKLSDAAIDQILSHFDLDNHELSSVEVQAEEEGEIVSGETAPPVVEDPQEVEPISPPEEALSTTDIQETPAKEEEAEAAHIPSAEETISSDQLLEMIEEDQTTDLDKIKLIKAPKKELSGLKILGKVEVPERPVKKKNQEESTPSKRSQLSEEEREKRRLKAKKRREEAEAKKESHQKQLQLKKEKARKTAHYQKSIPTPPSAKPKISAKKVPEASHTLPTDRKKKQNDKKIPKTILGKFWRWLNSSGYE